MEGCWTIEGCQQPAQTCLLPLKVKAEYGENMQGTGIDCLISQPGLVKTPLNGRKLDHRKLSAIGVDLATKVYGQEASQAANCLIRPATDPTVEGERLSPSDTCPDAE